jgi:hypothetical protein
LKVELVRKELIKLGQLDGSPFGPGAKSDDMLSRMLGRGLAERVVLVLDGEGVPTAMEKVVLTETLSEVFEDSEDSVEDDSSDSSRLCTLRLWISSSDSISHLSPSQYGTLWSMMRVSAGAAASGAAARACETKQTKTAKTRVHDVGRHLCIIDGSGWFGRDDRPRLSPAGDAAAEVIVWQLQESAGATSLCATAPGGITSDWGSDCPGQTSRSASDRRGTATLARGRDIVDGYCNRSSPTHTLRPIIPRNPDLS